MLNIEYFTQRRFPNERFIQEASLYSGFEFISRCIDGCLSSGKAAADQQNSTESQPAANQIEAVTPATEAAQAAPNQTGEKEQTPAPAADNPAVSAAAQTRASCF